MPQNGLNRILLIDHHDLRRDTREQLLLGAGYEVVTADRFDLVEGYVQEAAFDLVVVSVADIESAAYSQRLRSANAALPILVLSDNGLYLPKESLITVMQSGYSLELVAEVGKMLLESAPVRNSKKPEVSGTKSNKPYYNGTPQYKEYGTPNTGDSCLRDDDYEPKNDSSESEVRKRASSRHQNGLRSDAWTRDDSKRES